LRALSFFSYSSRSDSVLTLDRNDLRRDIFSDNYWSSSRHHGLISPLFDPPPSNQPPTRRLNLTPGPILRQDPPITHAPQPAGRAGLRNPTQTEKVPQPAKGSDTGVGGYLIVGDFKIERKNALVYHCKQPLWLFYKFTW